MSTSRCKPSENDVLPPERKLELKLSAETKFFYSMDNIQKEGSGNRVQQFKENADVTLLWGHTAWTSLKTWKKLLIKRKNCNKILKQIWSHIFTTLHPKIFIWREFHRCANASKNAYSKRRIERPSLLVHFHVTRTQRHALNKQSTYKHKT